MRQAAAPEHSLPLLALRKATDLPQLLAERRRRVEQTQRDVSAIIEDVVRGGDQALRALSAKYDGRSADAPTHYGPNDLQRALAELDPSTRALLERAHRRIEAFAQVQRNALMPVELAIPGGRCGHEVAPVASAGCYAPAGRFPLPSTVLMTATTARVAGVAEVWAASPNPSPLMLAAAAIAGADGVLAAGGAQAVAALAYGVGGPPACAVIVGPGNTWVTAAKRQLYGQVGIDMLAGPTELVVIADATADPQWVAADLIAQAEHDPEALAVLIATENATIDAVRIELHRQVANLPTAATARLALERSCALLATNLGHAATLSDLIAPEHLQIAAADPHAVAARCRHYGAVFLGEASAEVLGDYGAGPNHTLPTGGTARFCAGLSVFDFLRVRTWIAIDDRAAAAPLYADAVALAQLEGLAGHARAAQLRSQNAAGGSSSGTHSTSNAAHKL